MKALKKLVYQWISQKYMNGCSSYNSLEVRKGCRSKKQARAVFDANGVPHARGKVFFNPWVAHKFAQEHGFPLCIKPNVSGFSRGSHFPITNYKELWKAIFFAKAWWPTTVVEQYLEGNNYRVVVVKGKIMSAIQRYSPYVIGNGVDTIDSLIDRENSVRKEMGLFPVMYPLQKGSVTQQQLKKQGYSLDSVLPAGKLVKLFYRISLAPGGIVEILDKDSIPEENKQLFLDVLEMFDANILGIDVIFEKGIQHSYKDQKCIFLEVNSRPYLKMHDYPRYGEKEDLSPYFKELDQLEIAEADVF